MFFNQNARGQRFSVVASQNGNARLGDDRPRVEFRRHIVHRASVFGARLGERPLVRVQAAQIRQQGRMNVENTSAPPLDESRHLAFA